MPLKSACSGPRGYGGLRVAQIVMLFALEASAVLEHLTRSLLQSCGVTDKDSTPICPLPLLTSVKFNSFPIPPVTSAGKLSDTVELALRSWIQKRIGMLRHCASLFKSRRRTKRALGIQVRIFIAAKKPHRLTRKL